MTTERTETLRFQWLGINGFRFWWHDRIVLLDPYLTRSRGVMPDSDLLERILPEADLIVVSHSHWDHIADVPAIASRTGARVVGSRTTVNICRAWGVPDSRLHALAAGDTWQDPDLAIRFVESRHALADNGQVPYAGELLAPPDVPSVAPDQLPEGGTFAPLFSFNGLRLLDIGSANLVDSALAGCEAHILLLSIARYENVPDFLARVLSAVKPKLVIPVHYDDFTRPLDEELVVQSYVNPAGFEAAMTSVAPDTEIRWPGLLEEMAVSVPS